MIKNKFIGEAPLNKTPEKGISFVIKKGAITTDKIANHAITLDKIADAVITNIINRVSDRFLNAFQEPLVSGINIKTINGESVLGEGNIKIDIDNCDCPEHIMLTQAQYDALTSYKDNALYFIVPDEAIDNGSSEVWHFGGTFPIRFSDNTGSWSFGDKFPIILV